VENQLDNLIRFQLTSHHSHEDTSRQENWNKDYQ